MYHVEVWMLDAYVISALIGDKILKNRGGCLSVVPVTSLYV